MIYKIVNISIQSKEKFLILLNLFGNVVCWLILCSFFKDYKTKWNI